VCDSTRRSRRGFWLVPSRRFALRANGRSVVSACEPFVPASASAPVQLDHSDLLVSCHPAIPLVSTINIYDWY
jgi:hypothetical protein